ncbi:TPA: SDR family oxidoreductase [Salmonella enterica]|nr:SDR family oxidoreductase [Salmonella enterica]
MLRDRVARKILCGSNNRIFHVCTDANGNHVLGQVGPKPDAGIIPQGSNVNEESGVIVNCSSIGGIVGGAERANYHAAKHGVLGLTKSAALEYAGRNIRVNAVCPGLIWTPMVDAMVASGQKDALEAMVKAVPLQRHGNPEEIADAVLWLSSDASSYVTGQSISVDGGLTMR